ncbi:hypothetical protein A2V49_03725 [candidate division WWE3 bacterium RBG_19FT_COMBO_34_6]|uniref:Lipid/polyisoprenoid-binding YceI-like domain-containing protein n=1 Tax=candidate division WWE3 bacterium RBG_19FT_COMBO_34_6 TaxID=1802612 RepID=A0A1F4ULA6_UNCKA|nr:MAG: hypothetical protein A2V49_03725 [candidate division WWE3 bacterium RBG_19FT_COMBO_34_6]
MKKNSIYLLIPLILTIILSSLVYYCQKRQNINLQKKRVEESQPAAPITITAEIGSPAQDAKPATAVLYTLNITNINLLINKSFYKFRDEQFVYTANNINGNGWMDKPSGALGFEISFHNSSFLLNNVKQIDEIRNTLENGDINIKFLLQDQEDFFIENNDMQKNIPVTITINNITRGEVVNTNVISNNDALKINGTIQINMSDYGIVPLLKNNIYEYDDVVKIDFEAEANPLN